MSDATPKVISEPTLRRLPHYHRYLKSLAEQGRDVVSCPNIGAALGLDPTQVRKDLEATGAVGRPRVGYSIPRLLEAIETVLGWNNVSQAFLAGAGHLGAALLGYRRFAESGLEIVAAFDTDPAKIGRPLHGREVLPLEKLPQLARRMHVMVGILAVPAEAAQAVADLMVEGGIRAIWNFAPVRLRVPETVIVQHEDLHASLAALTQKLASTLQAEVRKGAEHVR